VDLLVDVFVKKGRLTRRIRLNNHTGASSCIVFVLLLALLTIKDLLMYRQRAVQTRNMTRFSSEENKIKYSTCGNQRLQ
jgi:hypothetical protein